MKTLEIIDEFPYPKQQYISQTHTGAETFVIFVFLEHDVAHLCSLRRIKCCNEEFSFVAIFVGNRQNTKIL